MVLRSRLHLCEVIRERYERGSTILTSNRDSVEIGELFGDPLLASAAMDRLLQHAHVIAIEGESYRNPKSNQRKRAKRSSNREAQT